MKIFDKSDGGFGIGPDLTFIFLATPLAFLQPASRRSGNPPPYRRRQSRRRRQLRASGVSTYSPPKPADPFLLTMDLLRLKLNQWRESQLQDPDNKAYQDQLMKEMLALVTDANVAQIMQALSAQELTTPFGTEVLGHWLQADPTAATTWLASRPDATPMQSLAVADYWSSNYDGFQQLVASLPDSPWKQNLIQQTGEEMSRNDPQDAVKLGATDAVRQCPDLSNAGGGSNWISTDPNGALDWHHSVTDPAMRDQLTSPSAAQSYRLRIRSQAVTLAGDVPSIPATVNDATPEYSSETWVTRRPSRRPTGFLSFQREA